MASNGSSRRPRVLVAEDDADIRELLRLVLTRFGFEVLMSCNGLEAKAIVDSHEPDLAVLDVMMPIASGLDVLDHIRAHPTTTDMPVLFLTARALETDIAAAFRAGCDDYLTKPFALQDLVARVRRLSARIGDQASAGAVSVATT